MRDVADIGHIIPDERKGLGLRQDELAAASGVTEQNKADLTACAENILFARKAHFPATIADLYDPETMPENLRRAHEENDETLERIYIGRRFKNDTERLEKLFELYTKMAGKGKGAID
jgi:transcriptional regulator with XRE-family HTH domain